MMRKTICTFLILLCTLSATAGSTPIDTTDTTKTLLRTVWKAQTIEGLNSGIWVIPEDAINQYFAFHAETNKVKNPNLKLLVENKMQVAFDSSVGRVRLTCDVKQFIHNQTESYAEVYVRKKEVVDKPILTWMLKYISLGAIADLYGNPLKDIKQFDARFSGNTLKVNFRPIVEKSLLRNPIGKKVEISRITTREGALELHTNMKADDLLDGFLGN